MILKKKYLIPICFLTLSTFFISACKSSDSVVNSLSGNQSDTDILLKLVDEDESLQSFEPNYNEDEAMNLFGNSLAKSIYPVRVGQRMRLTERNLEVEFEGDEAIGVLTKTFSGVLLIAASFDEFEFEPGVRPDSNLVDTLVQKEFTAVVTRNIKFIKVENSRNPERNWRIKAVSLPEGGTGSANIFITNMKIDLPNGESIEIDSPNEYYLERFPGYRRQIPSVNRGEEVTVTIELQSIYMDEDFVTLTYGAIRGGRHHRVKKHFDLINESFDGQFYNRTYQQSWIIRQMPGHKHAIINAVPKQVIFDSETEVEEHSWGVPYVVR